MSNNVPVRWWLLCLSLLLVSRPVSAASLTISTFDSSLDGWLTTDTGTFAQQATGGNPGGYLFLDNCECQIAELIAPSPFLGDLSAYVGGTFSFDGRLIGGGGSFFDGPNSIPGGPYRDYGILRLIGPSLSAEFDLAPSGAIAPSNAWQAFSVNLDAASFGLSATDFSTLMQNVTSVRLTVEGLWGAEQQGIDNIRLQGAADVIDPTAVPEPTSLVLFSTGALAFVRGQRRRSALSHDPRAIRRR